MNNLPNIFDYAPNELSQDAFIIWLLRWSNPIFQSYEAHSISCEFLMVILNKFDIDNFSINSVEIYKQFNSIDILIKLNGSHFIIIENKVKTKNHSGQLKRYYDLVRNKFGDDARIYPIYYKMYDQSNILSIHEAGYKLFTRIDFLNLYRNSNIDLLGNNILMDGYKHVLNIDASLNSWSELSLLNWTNDSWRGFYHKIKLVRSTGDWDYVPNKSGGFVGYWWNFQEVEINGIRMTVYYQLNRDDFLIKVRSNKILENHLARKLLRDKMNIKISSKNWGSCKIGKTVNMTAVKILEPYLIFDDDKLNLEETLNKIKFIENSISI